MITLGSLYIVHREYSDRKPCYWARHEGPTPNPFDAMVFDRVEDAHNVMRQLNQKTNCFEDDWKVDSVAYILSD